MTLCGRADEAMARPMVSSVGGDFSMSKYGGGQQSDRKKAAADDD